MSVNSTNVIPIATAINDAINSAYANNTANANHENVIAITNAIEKAIVAEADANNEIANKAMAMAIANRRAIAIAIANGNNAGAIAFAIKDATIDENIDENTMLIAINENIDTKIDTVIERETDKAIANPKYPPSCYSLLAVYDFNSKSFWLGIAVFSFQLIFSLLLLVMSFLRVLDVPDDDNANTIAYTIFIWATQFVAVLAIMFFGGASTSDFAQGSEMIGASEHYDGEHHIKFAGYMQLGQAYFATVSAIFLIATSYDVIEIILNFAAVKFIFDLDDDAFRLAKSGKFGGDMKTNANNIGDKHALPKCISEQEKVSGGRMWLINGCFFLFLFILSRIGISLRAVRYRLLLPDC